MRDNIWFTYKARINAHHRLEWLEKHSQFILVWYAILSAILSIVTIRFPTVLGSNTDSHAARDSSPSCCCARSIISRSSGSSRNWNGGLPRLSFLCVDTSITPDVMFMCNDTLHTGNEKDNAPKCGNTFRASNQNVS